MVTVNIDYFEMSYEESVSYFKRLENLEKFRRTNSPSPTLPVDNKSMLPVVWVKLGNLLTKGVTIVTKIITIQLIVEQLLRPNSRKGSF